MTLKRELNLGNKTYITYKTGVEEVPYKLIDGEKVLNGIRNQKDYKIILVLNNLGKIVTSFNEETWKEVL